MDSAGSAETGANAARVAGPNRAKNAGRFESVQPVEERAFISRAQHHWAWEQRQERAVVQEQPGELDGRRDVDGF